ncbi:MAG TPA: hypothetical protein VMW27_03980 [Thermoanaerobaculia bacterium]|nr:hypothetical protein [Thermoanaerobaculia bacterium]
MFFGTVIYKGADVLTVLRDKESQVQKRSVVVLLVFSLLACLSPLFADPVIQRGIDIFVTPADGRTYYDFAQAPIPAGFFCKGSRAFAGRVAFKGLPLVTETPGQLLGGDTVVERLDDAVFDAKGMAVTRIQFRALSLVSIQPLKTSCGSFHVYVSLGDKQQRVTAMSIHRTEAYGGQFFAPLAVDARITFVPVKPGRNKGARNLELAGSFTFPATSKPWSLASAGKKSGVPVVVDTNGDLKADTRLPGTSNFFPGSSPELFTPNKQLIGACPCEPVCHATQGEMHCTESPYQCYPVICP